MWDKRVPVKPTTEEMHERWRANTVVFIAFILAVLSLIVLYESWHDSYGQEPTREMLDMAATRFKGSHKAKSRKRRAEETKKSNEGTVNPPNPTDEVSKDSEIQRKDGEQNESGLNENISPKQAEKARKPHQD